MKRALYGCAFALAAAALGCDDRSLAWAPLATGQRGVNSIAADGEFVYWSTAQGAVRRVSIDGGPVETVIDNITNPSHVAVDGSHVYWTTLTGDVARAPKQGGLVETLAADEADAVGLRIDDAHVYWARRNGPVRRAPKTGEAPVTLAEDHDGPSSLALAGVSLFWSSGAVRQVSIDGGAVSELGGALGSRLLAASSTHLCWTGLDPDALAVDPTSNAQAISRTVLGRSDLDESLDIGHALVDTRVVLRGLVNVDTLLADESQIYFSTLDGTVNKLPIDGGEPTTFARMVRSKGEVAAGVPIKTSIAVDSTYVFWAHQQSDAIFIFPKL